jgi:hypothetical protein
MNDTVQGSPGVIQWVVYVGIECTTQKGHTDLKVVHGPHAHIRYMGYSFQANQFQQQAEKQSDPLSCYSVLNSDSASASPINALDDSLISVSHLIGQLFKRSAFTIFIATVHLVSSWRWHVESNDYIEIC